MEPVAHFHPAKRQAGPGAFHVFGLAVVTYGAVQARPKKQIYALKTPIIGDMIGPIAPLFTDCN